MSRYASAFLPLVVVLFVVVAMTAADVGGVAFVLVVGDGVKRQAYAMSTSRRVCLAS